MHSELSRVAIRSPQYSKLCHVPGEGMITIDAAREQGFEVLTAEAASERQRQVDLGRLPDRGPDAGPGSTTAAVPARTIDVRDEPCPAPKPGQLARWHEFLPHAVTLPDGRVEPVSVASSRGWPIVGDRRPAPVRVSVGLGLRGDAANQHGKEIAAAVRLINSTPPEEQTYAAAVAGLPEARLRPLSAARIAAAYTFATMPLDRAAAFLRGLPAETETDEDGQSLILSSSSASKVNERLLALWEMKLRARGDDEAREYLGAVAYARSVAASGAMTLSDALAAVGITESLMKGAR